MHDFIRVTILVTVLATFGVCPGGAQAPGGGFVPTMPMHMPVPTLTPVTTQLPTQPGENVLRADLPWKVEINKPFKMFVWYNSTNPSSGSLSVSTDVSEKVRYDPDTVKLQHPDRREKIMVTVENAPSGLAELMVMSDCCEDIAVTVDAGFKGRLRWKTPPSLESRSVRPATIELVDSQDQPLALDAPMHLKLVATNAEIRAAGKPWGSALDFALGDGDRSTPTFEMRPTPLDVASGTIQVTGYINKPDYIILKTNMDFDISPPWWLRLGMAACGGLLFSVYRIFRKKSGWTLSSIVRAGGTGVAAGLFAYVLADLDVLGIKIDTTHLRAFVVLGLVVAYAGIEPILSAFVKKPAARGSAQNDDGAPDGDK